MDLNKSFSNLVFKNVSTISQANSVPKNLPPKASTFELLC